MNTLEHNEINKEKLVEVFEMAAIQPSFEDCDENEIYLKEGLEFPLWLSVQKESKRIQLYTFLSCREEAPIDGLPAFADSLNRKYHTVQFSSYVNDQGRGRISGGYTIYTGFGLIVPQLIHTVRKFSSIFHDGLNELDSEDVFFK